jgi:hypothetical protein
MKNNIVRSLLNILAVIVTIVVNGLAVALPLNGRSTASISDSFHVLFVPAGYVFSIWGIIYIGLIVYAIYQVLPAVRDNQRIRQLDGWFLLSNVANSSWIFFWHYGVYLMTVVMMLVLLVSLIVIFLRLGIGQVKVNAAEKWSVHLLFSIYLGWITVATIANITDLLAYWQWNGWGVSAAVWTVIMLAAGVIIAGLMSLTRGDIAYLAVLVWAFTGIWNKQSGTPLVANSALLAAGLVVILAGLGWVLSGRRQLRQI